MRAQNEAQVAAVIGHEAGHYIKRHSLKSWLDAKSRTDLMVLLSIGLAVGGVPAGGDIFNLTQLLQAGFMAKHSRDNEREADRIGLAFLTYLLVNVEIPLNHCNIFKALLSPSSNETTSHSTLIIISSTLTSSPSL